MKKLTYTEEIKKEEIKELSMNMHVYHEFNDAEEIMNIVNKLEKLLLDNNFGCTIHEVEVEKY